MLRRRSGWQDWPLTGSPCRLRSACAGVQDRHAGCALSGNGSAERRGATVVATATVASTIAGRPRHDDHPLSLQTDVELICERLATRARSPSSTKRGRPDPIWLHRRGRRGRRRAPRNVRASGALSAIDDRSIGFWHPSSPPMSRAVTFSKLGSSKNGVRYVVVTLQDHEAWLANILTSWQFTA